MLARPAPLQLLQLLRNSVLGPLFQSRVFYLSFGVHLLVLRERELAYMRWELRVRNVELHSKRADSHRFLWSVGRVRGVPRPERSNLRDGLRSDLSRNAVRAALGEGRRLLPTDLPG